MCELFLEKATWSWLSAAGLEVTPACTRLRVGPRAAANGMWGTDPQEQSAGGLGPRAADPVSRPIPPFQWSWGTVSIERGQRGKGD